MHHVRKGCMTLHEHGCIKRNLQSPAELGHSLGFVLAASIRQENEGDLLALQADQGLLSSRKRLGAANEDAVDASTDISG